LICGRTGEEMEALEAAGETLSNPAMIFARHPALAARTPDRWRLETARRLLAETKA
jgi:hypothetical protein